MLTIAVRGVKQDGCELRVKAAREAIGMENRGGWAAARTQDRLRHGD